MTATLSDPDGAATGSHVGLGNLFERLDQLVGHNRGNFKIHTGLLMPTWQAATCELRRATRTRQARIRALSRQLRGSLERTTMGQ